MVSMSNVLSFKAELLPGAKNLLAFEPDFAQPRFFFDLDDQERLARFCDLPAKLDVLEKSRVPQTQERALDPIMGQDLPA